MVKRDGHQESKSAQRLVLLKLLVLLVNIYKKDVKYELLLIAWIIVFYAYNNSLIIFHLISEKLTEGKFLTTSDYPPCLLVFGY